MWKVNYEKKSSTSNGEICLSCTTQECDNVATSHSIFALSSVNWTLMGSLKQTKFSTCTSKSGRGRLRDVVVYKRWSFTRDGCLPEFPNIVIFDWGTFGILENWSQPARGSAVIIIMKLHLSVMGKTHTNKETQTNTLYKTEEDYDI